MEIPIKKTAGIELIPTDRDYICRAKLTSVESVRDLSWDRFVRLKACADAVKKLVPHGSAILDVGGFDGALALFLPECQIDLVDPASTGGSFLQTTLTDKAYELVTAIDVLEHIEPAQRRLVLKEFSRIAEKFVVLNYPCSQSIAAQKVVLKATNNPLIKEHVHWELPDSSWVLQTMKEFGFSGLIVPHSNPAIWVGQYISQNLVPEVATDLNSYLIEHHSNEPSTNPLYHLVICNRQTI